MDLVSEHNEYGRHTIWRKLEEDINSEQEENISEHENSSSSSRNPRKKKHKKKNRNDNDEEKVEKDVEEDEDEEQYYGDEDEEEKEEKYYKEEEEEQEGNIMEYSSISGSGSGSSEYSRNTNSDPNNLPTMSPVSRPLYPPTDAQFTDLAHQEINNWMSGGPKEKTSSEQQTQDTDNEDLASQTQGDKDEDETITVGKLMGDDKGEGEGENAFTDLAHQEIGSWMGGGPKPKGSYDDLEPSEMEIEVPMTEEEEEEIDEEIEDWEEEHGKVPILPIDDTNTGQDEGDRPDGMYIPQTEKEEKEINDEIKEWEEEHEEDEEDNNWEPTSTETPEAPPTPVDPLVVSPSWTPPKIEPKHTLATGTPTMAPMPSAFETATGITNTAFTAAVVVPIMIIVCCLLKYFLGRSKQQDSGRGKYRAIDNAFSDNVFSEEFSDDEDDLENDVSWRKSKGKRVLEMSKIRKRNGDADLSLQEMNG
jgi:hypothetical protein